jgi:hypothetical protein
MTVKNSVGPDEHTPNETLPPEMVRQVSERVYAMWQRELKIEQERRQGRGDIQPGRRPGDR